MLVYLYQAYVTLSMAGLCYFIYGRHVLVFLVHAELDVFSASLYIVILTLSDSLP